LPKIKFSSELKKQETNYNFPKLKLEQGEKARIVCLEDPTVEYHHRIQQPKLDADGAPLMENLKDRNGREYEAHEMQFKSTPLCLGDFETLEEKGSDPKNCPMCAMAKDHPDWMKGPARRFAMHVIKYRTKANSTDLATPFSVECVVWSFTDRIYSKLVDFRNEHGSEEDGLKKKDLLLGPCENKMFQKFDIAISSKAEWLASEERMTRTAETFNDNQIEDLAIAIGSKKPKHFVEQDLEDVTKAWRAVEQYSRETKDQPKAESLDSGLENIFGARNVPGEGERQTVFPDVAADADTTGADEKVAAAPASSAEELLSGLTSDAPKVEKKEEPSDGPVNFQDLLAGLT
jgi:hypothetical protein